MNQCQKPHAGCTEPFKCKNKAFYSESLLAVPGGRYTLHCSRLVSARRLPTHTLTHTHTHTARMTYCIWIIYHIYIWLLLWAQSSIHDPKNCRALRSISAPIKASTSCEDLYHRFTQLLVVKLQGKKLTKLLQGCRKALFKKKHQEEKIWETNVIFYSWRPSERKTSIWILTFLIVLLK